jgi:ribokinase
VVQFEVPMPVVEAVLRLAHRFQIPVMVNAAPAYPIEAELIPLIDYLVVNEHEAEVLSGAGVTDLESAKRAGRILVQRGAKHVVLTLGALGALVCSPTQEFHVPGFPIRAIDTTAAGDAFIGGLAVSLLDSAGGLPEKVRFANAAGAVAATRMGAQSSLPNRAEVEAMLASLHPV